MFAKSHLREKSEHSWFSSDHTRYSCVWWTLCRENGQELDLTTSSLLKDSTCLGRMRGIALSLTIAFLRNRKFPAANSKQAACKLSQAVLVMAERIWALRLTSFYSCQNFTADQKCYTWFSCNLRSTTSTPFIFIFFSFPCVRFTFFLHNVHKSTFLCW